MTEQRRQSSQTDEWSCVACGGTERRPNRTDCAECHRRRERQRHAEKKADPTWQRQRRQYRSKTRDAQRERITRWKYGISFSEAEEMLAQQGGCAACGADILFGTVDGAHIDHDHDTGDVRGILCRGCNVALGQVAESPLRLRSLADYIERVSSPT